MDALVAELRASGLDDEPDAASEGEEGGFDFAGSLAGVLGIQLEDVAGGDEQKKTERTARQTQAVAGMAVMMLLFGLIHCGGTLLDERDSGTLERLRLAPGATGALLGGKFLFTWIVGLQQLAVLLLFGKLVFDVPIFRAPLALAVLAATTAAAVTGFGVLFAVLSRSRKQLEGLSTIVVLTMSALGGSWWPLAMTPDWYQKLGHLTLNAWAMDGFQGIFWYGKGLGGILPELGVLAGIALGTSLFAWRLWLGRVSVGRS
jgi:ABC-2 type transport system permease protein